MTLAIYNRLPDVLSDIIAKNLHELNMADLMNELTKYGPDDWYCKGHANKHGNQPLVGASLGYSGLWGNPVDRVRRGPLRTCFRPLPPML